MEVDTALVRAVMEGIALEMAMDHLPAVAMVPLLVMEEGMDPEAVTARPMVPPPVAMAGEAVMAHPMDLPQTVTAAATRIIGKSPGLLLE